MSTLIPRDFTGQVIIGVTAGLVLIAFSFAYKKFRAKRQWHLSKAKEEMDFLKQLATATYIYARNLKMKEALNQTDYEQMTYDQRRGMDLCNKSMQEYGCTIMNQLPRGTGIKSRHNKNLKKQAEKIRAQDPWKAEDLELFHDLYHENRTRIFRELDTFEMRFPE